MGGTEVEEKGESLCGTEGLSPFQFASGKIEFFSNACWIFKNISSLKKEHLINPTYLFASDSLKFKGERTVRMTLGKKDAVKENSLIYFQASSGQQKQSGFFSWNTCNSSEEEAVLTAKSDLSSQRAGQIPVVGMLPKLSSVKFLSEF